MSSTPSKIYKLYGINVAVEMLRPGAEWEFDGQKFTKWNDERPCPTPQDVYDVMEKIMAFENSIDTIYTKEQLLQFKADEEKYAPALENIEV
jgi:hypothetical protein